MFKILRLPAIARPLAWILLFSFMMMINGCYYFRVRKSDSPPRELISKMQDEQKFIIIHLDDKIWQLKDIIISEKDVSGIISEVSGHTKYLELEPNSSNRYFKREPKSESYVLNEVHIYVTEFSETDPGKISIPVNSIQKIEIYDKDSGATVASWIFGGLLVGLGAFAVLLIIVMLTKSSCPFVYAFDGNELHFFGEIFSGATQPGLERDDYLPIKGIVSQDKMYRLKLTNEVHEIQSVNLASLIVVDHPEEFSVLIDKYGTIRTFNKPVPPAFASNSAGKNILSAITKMDSLAYSGDVNSTGGSGIEEIILRFPKTQSCESAKLIIRAKNTFWLDVLFTKFHSLFGERYPVFASKQESASGEDLKKFLLNQNIPLSVYIEKDGKWQFADYYNIAGPMAFREDILGLDLTGINSDTIRIKLETGFLFWEVDYAGMDFSIEESIIPLEFGAHSAIDKYGTDVRDLVRSKDNNYKILKEVGDEFELNFNVPELKNSKRTIFLHSSGYYKILREQTGKAEKKTLRSFRKSNRFPEFSKEIFEKLPVR